MIWSVFEINKCNSLLSWLCVYGRSAQSKKATWRLGDISGSSEATRHGSLQATFDLSSSVEQKSANVVAVQFLCDSSSLSGVDFEITSAGYRVSLIKKRIVTGIWLAVHWSLSIAWHTYIHMHTVLTTVFQITWVIQLHCDFFFHLFQTWTSSWDMSEPFVSSMTPSHQVFLGYSMWAVPFTSFIQSDSISIIFTFMIQHV